MSTGNYTQAWDSYRQAMAALYAAPADSQRERGTGGITANPAAEPRAQALLASARDLHLAAASGLASSAQPERELAQLKLLASAALNISVANDLFAAAEAGPESQGAERGGSSGTAVTYLQSILGKPASAGIDAVLSGSAGPERGGTTPTTVAEAQSALHDAVANALIDIPADAAALSQASLLGMAKLPLPVVVQAGSLAANEIVTKLGDTATGLAGRAVAFVAQAIDNILAALGESGQAEARKQAAAWIKDLKEGTLASALLARLYEPELIKKEVMPLIDKATAGTDALNKTSAQIDDLAAKFREQKKTLGYLITGLNWVQPALVALPPWGPLGISAAYLASIGFIVYSGGDYVDWYRTGNNERLNFTPGVRTLVHKALDPQKPSA